MAGHVTADLQVSARWASGVSSARCETRAGMSARTTTSDFTEGTCLCIPGDNEGIKAAGRSLSSFAGVVPLWGLVLNVDRYRMVRGLSAFGLMGQACLLQARQALPREEAEHFSMASPRTTPHYSENTASNPPPRGWVPRFHGRPGSSVWGSGGVVARGQDLRASLS